MRMCTCALRLPDSGVLNLLYNELNYLKDHLGPGRTVRTSVQRSELHIEVQVIREKKVHHYDSRSSRRLHTYVRGNILYY